MGKNSKGVAITVGLNSVDPKHYQGWSGKLNACEADAKDMAALAKSQKFAVTTLLTKQATRDAVQHALAAQAEALAPGDLLMLSYSGHGGQLPDLNSDESDGQDETWCLYDGELVDDELYAALSDFASGVRILVFSDSCHSGTAVKEAYFRAGASAGVSYRAMPAAVGLRTFEANKRFYTEVLTDPKNRAADEKLKASVLLLSGCQDNQYSADGEHNGLFTGTLLQVWNGGKFKGTYRSFHKAILARMPPDQSPNYYRVGKTNMSFLRQRVFTI
ncbi:MAG: caspase family protein [Deltaproteobacteria bacterium]|nr:caspase family protein [Deltaproteobacteria bacterium]